MSVQLINRSWGSSAISFVSSAGAMSAGSEAIAQMTGTAFTDADRTGRVRHGPPPELGTRTARANPRSEA